MSEDTSVDQEAFEENTQDGVSAGRKRTSAIVLAILLVVLAIEGRAGLGHMMSGKNMQQIAPDGVFEPTLSVEELESKMTLFPSKSLAKETDTEFEYRYGWFSVLRPLLGRPEAAYYVAVFKSDPPAVNRFSQQAED